MAGVGTLAGPNIAILYSATGGGHRSVALALKEAAEGPPHFADVTCLDILHESTLFPFSRGWKSVLDHCREGTMAMESHLVGG